MDEESSDIPMIEEARAYYTHRRYDAALEIYSEILPTLSPDSSAYNVVLLEYAVCLLDKTTYETEMCYRNMILHRNQKQTDDADEDLEICWESLESCRVAFEVIGDRNRLVRVHKGLGDVHGLNNRFVEAAAEYLKAYDYCEDAATEAKLLEEVAEAYKNGGDLEVADGYYRRSAEMYELAGDKKSAKEVRVLGESCLLIKSAKAEQPVGGKGEDVSSGGDPVDVNHLKR